MKALVEFEPYFSIVEGDLLKLPKEGYLIAHQCNCDGVYGGLAGAIVREVFDFTKIAKPKLRTIQVFEAQRVVNLYAQKHPGAPSGISVNDTKSVRLIAFEHCLKEFEKYLLDTQPKIQGIAFPYLIGCYRGGGDWKKYFELIWNFSRRINGMYEVVLVQLPNGERK